MQQTSSMNDDDNQGIHRHDDAPHMVQLGYNLVYCVHRLRLSAASSIASSPDEMQRDILQWKNFEDKIKENQEKITGYLILVGMVGSFGRSLFGSGQLTFVID